MSPYGFTVVGVECAFVGGVARGFIPQTSQEINDATREAEVRF